MGKKSAVKDEDLKLSKKDERKVQKLSSQREYHAARNEKEEVAKIQSQIDKVWADARAKEASEGLLA